MHERLRNYLLDRWAAMACDHPVAVIVASLLLAAASVAYTAMRMTFQADRNELLSRDIDWNQRFIDYNHHFQGITDLIVVIEVPGDEAGKALARRYADVLGGRLESDKDHVRAVYWRIDAREAPPAAIRLLKWEPFQQRLEQIATSGPLLRSATTGELLAAATGELAASEAGGDDTGPQQAVERIGQLEQIVALIETAMAGQPIEPALQRMAYGEAGVWEYIGTEDGQLLIMQIDPKLDPEAYDPALPAMDAVNQHMRQVVEQNDEFKALSVGLTGIPVLEASETTLAVRDSTWCSVVSVAAISLLLILAFAGWQLPLLAVATLLIAIAWSFGFVTLAVGHLQVLSVVFTVILLGLGIGFGIHLISQFELVRHEHPKDHDGFKAAMQQTLRQAGPGIITGAVTTSIAFATTLLTDFKGMAEMGLIAGVGIMLCLLAMLTVLPALMRLFRNKPRHIKLANERLIDFHQLEYLMVFVRRPVTTIVLAAVVIVPCALAVNRVKYDYNLQNLQPEGSEPVVWQDKIMAHDQAIWYAASITDDLAKAKRVAGELSKLESVGGLGGVGLLYEAEDARKTQAMAEARQALGPSLQLVPTTVEAKESTTSLMNNLRALGLALGFAMNRADVKAEPLIEAALKRLGERVKGAIGAIESAREAGQAEQRAEALQAAFTGWRSDVRRQVVGVLEDRPLTPADMPAVLERMTVGRDDEGRTLYVVTASPKNDVWDPVHLKQFVADLQSVDPLITGTPVQIFLSSELITGSYRLAGVYAFIAVFLLVFVDFQRLLEAFFSLLPVIVGFVMLFAVMWLAGIAINLANIIILPLLFGVGVDCGVHMLHRFRQYPQDQPPGLSGGTGKGVLLNTLTTMIGFASLMLASHRGIQSLGYVLTLGMGLTLIACLVLMPAVLELRRR